MRILSILVLALFSLSAQSEQYAINYAAVQVQACILKNQYIEKQNFIDKKTHALNTLHAYKRSLENLHSGNAESFDSVILTGPAYNWEPVFYKKASVFGHTIERRSKEGRGACKAYSGKTQKAFKHSLIQLKSQYPSMHVNSCSLDSKTLFHPTSAMYPHGWSHIKLVLLEKEIENTQGYIENIKNERDLSELNKTAQQIYKSIVMDRGFLVEGQLEDVSQRKNLFRLVGAGGLIGASFFAQAAPAGAIVSLVIAAKLLLDIEDDSEYNKYKAKYPHCF
ncbi:MAG: hypothetical protein MK008_07585 [Bdellovibrionales bacterium]|nr:hypothetical protein [Bdellovibrionales bacterium]